MIRITENSLIIEIPTGNTNPLEDLGNMQQGLLTLIGVINYEEPAQEIQNGLWHLRKLLKEMSLTPGQLQSLQSAIETSLKLKQSFSVQ